MTIVRPAEAAGLVLIRQARSAAGGAEVLLGRRSQGSRFMPGIYVFPGGRLSALDRRPSGFAEDLAAPPPGLDARTRTRLAVFARAALRETFEETGLLLGLPMPAAAPADAATARAPDVWAAFARAGLAPAFGALGLVARAITPAASPLHFHTRFFVATLRVLEEALARRTEDAQGARGTRPAPLFRWVGPEMRPRTWPGPLGRRA